ncbi:agamous-like MADS-box protein AGL15 [Tanacetum coccineum]
MRRMMKLITRAFGKKAEGRRVHTNPNLRHPKRFFDYTSVGEGWHASPEHSTFAVLLSLLACEMSSLDEPLGLDKLPGLSDIDLSRRSFNRYEYVIDATLNILARISIERMVCQDKRNSDRIQPHGKRLCFLPGIEEIPVELITESAGGVRRLGQSLSVSLRPSLILYILGFGALIVNSGYRILDEMKFTKEVDPDVEAMKAEIAKLQKGAKKPFRLMMGKELEGLSYKELDNLERQLHNVMLAVNNRKDMVLLEEIEQTKLREQRTVHENEVLKKQVTLNALGEISEVARGTMCSPPRTRRRVIKPTPAKNYTVDKAAVTKSYSFEKSKMASMERLGELFIKMVNYDFSFNDHSYHGNFFHSLEQKRVAFEVSIRRRKAERDAMGARCKWPEWDPCREMVRGYRDYGRELPSADVS